MLSLFMLAAGDPVKTIEMCANFGRDADTIASMAGALAGAFAGVSALNRAWVDRIEAGGDDQAHLAEELVALIRLRQREAAHLASLYA